MKKLFTFCVSLLAALSVFAYDFQSGDLFYNITSSSAPYTVEVTQQSQDYSNYSGVDTIVIPETVTYNAIIYSVTSIGESAFHNCSNLTSITIPNSVTSIGGSAFDECSVLTSVTIGSGVTSIGWGAFFGCSGLVNTNYTGDLEGWCNMKFGGFHANPTGYSRGFRINNEEIKDLVIPTTVDSIHAFAFDGCSSLTSVTIGNSVTSIEDWAFGNCSGLTSITIPNSVTSIGDWAFTECSLLETIYVEAATPPTLIGDVFTGTPVSLCNIPCGTLATYEASDWASQVGEFLEEGCIDPTWQITYTSTDGNIVTPYATDVFGANIVSNTYENGVGTITFDGPVTCIGERALISCSNLMSVAIPNSVTSIGGLALYNCSSLTSVTIPNSVTNIGEKAFWGCDSITKNNFIGDVASWCDIKFADATANPMYYSHDFCINNLEIHDLVIPNTVDSIHNYAFYDASSLTSITIPNSVTNIGESAFAGCSSITSITIPNSVTSIGSSAFVTSSSILKTNYTGDVASWCDIKFGNASANPMCCSHNFYINEQEIKDLIIPNTVNSIHDYAFYNCSSLTSITIPNSVTNIGENAFSNCSGLTSIVVENGNAVYDSRDNCNAIIETPTNTLIVGCQNTIIPNSVTSIGSGAFSGCSSLTSITIPNGVTNIGNYAFQYCSSLTSITITNSVTTIGKYAFSGCSSLTSMTIPNSVTSIGNGAFNSCSSLTSITIPNSVTSIGELAFHPCSSLDTIHVEATSPPVLGEDAFNSTPVCYIPCGTLATYEASDWAQYVSEFVEEGCIDSTWQIKYTSSNGNIVTPTRTDAFGAKIVSNTYENGVGTITFDGPVTSIGDYAFNGCNYLKSILIPNSVTTIGKKAFSVCNNLASITIGKGVTSIEVGATDCKSLTSIVVDVENPIYDSRENCNAIIETSTNTLIQGCRKTVIPQSVTHIGEQAFYMCEYLSSITIPNGVISIGEDAFYYCKSLTSITIPNSVTSVGLAAFSACDKLTSMVVDAANPVYDSRENCNAIIETATNTLISGCPNTIIPQSVIHIGELAFLLCNISSITIPNSVTSIGKEAFAYCDISSITIPNSVNYIGDGAFQTCGKLVQIAIPDRVTTIKHFTFANCSSLTSITIHNAITAIESAAFANCSSLTSVTIPNSVTSIGDGAFAYCKALTSIVVDSGNTTYDSRESCNAIIETATNTLIAGCKNTIIPNSITSIDYSAFNGCDSLTSITIPNSVTRIGYCAFRSCSSLSTIDLPNNLTELGYMAFGYCDSLTSITIPKSVTRIAQRAFNYCPVLDTIYVEATTPPTLQDSTVFIGTPSPVCYIPCGTLAAYEASDWASQVGSFVEDCVEGQQIYYTSTDGNIVTPYATDVFGANIVSNTYENGVGTITFDGPVTSIGEEAFRQCSSIASITIPKSVTSIGQFAFGFCSSLTSITIPENVTSIVRGTFQGCSSIVSIVVDNNNTMYDSRNDCNAIIETATNVLVSGCKNTIIPNGITTIDRWAFASNKSLTSITIPNTVMTIADYAFHGCSSLPFILIPNSVTSIGVQAFYNCSMFSSFTIPKSVTTIGKTAFKDCTSLDTIYVEATTPPTLGENVLGYSPVFTSSPTCYIPCGTLDAYQSSDWAQYVSEFVEEGCAPIQMCGDDLYWEYADGVLTITGTGEMYDYAADTDVPWYDVRGNIKTVSLPNAMTKIGQNAFYKCTAMTSINMPTSLTAIGEKAFAQDTKLTGELTLPASLTTIDERAFFNCKAVTAFHIEATTPPTLQDKAFDYVVSPIHVPCGYGHVYGKHAQWGMLNLEMCELLQDNVYYYPIDGHTARAVTYHSNPTDTIVIPSAVVIDGVLRTVTEVADFAFTDCDNLPAIYFNEGLEYIGERAFVRCYGLHGTIVLPATLETIGERAFSYCDNVEKYLLQAMTPPVLGEDVFTGDNKNALFYVSCEAMDDYKVATNWSSLKSRLRDACLNIYHYNTALGANGVYTTEDTLVASIYYRRHFTPNRWETLYLPFEVDRVTVLEDGVEYDLTAWDIVNGGHYFLAKPDGMLNKEILFGFTDELESHTPYIIQFPDTYYADKIITFYGKESWNKLSTSFEVLSSSTWMQIAGNTTLQDQLLEKPVYMLRSGLDFILQKTTTTLHPFECYVMPYTAQSGAPARMSVRLRDDVATAVESMKGNESRLAYTINGNTLTVYPQGQAFSIYSLNGASIYSCEAGKETVDCELNSGCYLLHAGTEAHKIML